jgi:hypothetical protein
LIHRESNDPLSIAHLHATIEDLKQEQALLFDKLGKTEAEAKRLAASQIVSNDQVTHLTSVNESLTQSLNRVNALLEQQELSLVQLRKERNGLKELLVRRNRGKRKIHSRRNRKG